jgi:hypothetical protein
MTIAGLNCPHVPVPPGWQEYTCRKTFIPGPIIYDGTGFKSAVHSPECTMITRVISRRIFPAYTAKLIIN